jgi:ElaB/YqjD/DUF883 family membrane-anchored ribosome-binding protein
MNATTETDVAKERLVHDFKAVVADTEDLLKATASQTGEKVAAARVKVEESLADAKKRLTELSENLTEKAKVVAHKTDVMVHEHPWQAVGLAAAVGILLGMLISRR